MQELNSQAQDLVDAGHFDPNAVEETRIVMEERFVIYCRVFYLVPFFNTKCSHPGALLAVCASRTKWMFLLFIIFTLG